MTVSFGAMLCGGCAVRPMIFVVVAVPDKHEWGLIVKMNDCAALGCVSCRYDQSFVVMRRLPPWIISPHIHVFFRIFKAFVE